MYLVRVLARFKIVFIKYLARCLVQSWCSMKGENVRQ